jgi:hypothetical protein
VKFTLKGTIGTFGRPNTPTANIPEKVDANHIVAVHSVEAGVDSDFHVKVVEEIKPHCVPGKDDDKGFHGCSFPHNFRSIVVVHPNKHTLAFDDGSVELAAAAFPNQKFPDHLLWAHEFGHLTGLEHRNDSDDPNSDALMHERDVFKYVNDGTLNKVQVSKAECDCFLSGPKSSGVCPQP